MSLSEKIAKAKKKYHSGNDFWAAELLIELETNCPGSAHSWAIASMRELIEVVQPEYSQQYHQWLRELNDLQVLSEEETRQANEAIWYSRKGSWANIVARLYWAYEFQLHFDQSNCRIELTRVMSMLGREPECREMQMAPAFRLLER